MVPAPRTRSTLKRPGSGVGPWAGKGARGGVRWVGEEGQVRTSGVQAIGRIRDVC